MNNKPGNNFHNKELEEALDKEDDLEYEEIEEEKEESASTSQHSRMERELFRAKMLKLFGIVIIGLIVVLIIGFMISIFTKKDYTYASTEEVMKEAAISYFEEYPKKLPASTEEIIEINVAVLVENKNMKELEFYLKDESCKGNVSVEKVSSKEYSYTPYLKCGNDYETTTFYDALKNEKNIVTEGFGLYFYNNEYIFRGTDVNNYVKFSDSDTIFRVIKVTSNNEVVLIQEEKSKNSYPWDERYNQNYDDNIGINDYKNSSISSVLEYFYKGKIGAENSSKYGEYYYDQEPTFLTKEDKKKLVKFKACVGKRSESDTSKDGQTDCSVTYETNISLPSVYDFLNASLDPNCTTTVSPSCQNYNYLVNETRFWLGNGTSEDSGKVYSVSSNYISSKKASTEMTIRPVVHLSEKVMLEKGKGTEENPYIIR